MQGAKRTLVVGVMMTILAAAAWLYQPVDSASAARTFYVSRNGSNGDGLSWATAWNELNRINWTAVQPGDTILIDGGAHACPALGPGYNCGMVYNSTLSLGKSGTSSAPITIQLASEGGRNGAVIIDGGITAWAGCAEYAAEPTPPSVPNGAGVRDTGLNANSVQWVIVDGTKWGGIEIRNHLKYGVSLSSSQHVTVRYLKLHHNTDTTDTTNGSVGLTQGWQSAYNTASRLEIFRNGQDAVRGAGDYFTLEESYLHDTYCNHPDGIQSFVPTGNSDVPDGEGEVRGLVVRRNIFDNIGLQNIFLGENATHNSWNVDVTITGNLFLNSDYVIKSKHGSSRNWQVHHNTIYGAQEFAVEWCCASPGAQAPMAVYDNIFANVKPGQTAFYMPTGGGNTTFSNNCLFNTGTRNGNISESGTVTGDPRFVNSSLGNFALATGSACAGKGASITSVNALLALSGSGAPTQTAPPSATATRTATNPPAATNTSVPPTTTRTATLPPSATATGMPPTATATRTATNPAATDTSQPSATSTASTTSAVTAQATETAPTPTAPAATATGAATTATTEPPTATFPPPTATSALPPGTTILTFAPAADAYVDAAHANSNYGGNDLVRTDASPEQRTYLRFNVSGVMGRTVTKVLLRIYANGSSSTGFEVQRADAPYWNEYGVNYNNRPRTSGVIAASGAHNHAQWVTVDLTGYVTGGGSYTLALLSNTSRPVGYPSREAQANQPQLEVHVVGEVVTLSPRVFVPVVVPGAP